MTDEYIQGFIAKCAAAGIDPEALIKQAQTTNNYTVASDPHSLDRPGSMFGDIFLSKLGRKIKDFARAKRIAMQSDFSRGIGRVFSPYINTRGRRALSAGQQGAGIGAGIGAVGGALSGAVGNDKSPSERAIKALVGSLVGAGGGALAGGTAGILSR